MTADKTRERDAVAAGERRITVLDGWRGVSVLFVIFGHLVVYHSGRPAAQVAYHLPDELAGLGVCIFFVISGLIITKLALREQAASGHLSVRAFYVRRFFRIVPPFYLYLLIVLILTVRGSIVQQDSQTLQAASFICDLPRADCGWFGGHSWSLAYEEQFYLLFPLLFVVLGARIRMVIGVLLLALLSVPVMRYALHLGPPWFRISHATYNFSFICAGAWVATVNDFMKRLCADRRAALISWGAALLLAAVLVLEMASHANPGSSRLLHARMLFIPTLEPLCIAWLVGSSIYESNRAARMLNLLPLQFVGTISYSLYLWQQLFTSAPSNYLGHSWILLTPLMFVCATLSYYLVERPSTRLAKRLMRAGMRLLALDAIRGLKRTV